MFSTQNQVIRIPPCFYVHILDTNSNVTFLEIGPQNYFLLENESLITGPLPFVTIRPGYYTFINDPVKEISINYLIRKITPYQQLFGEKVIKLFDKPFPLYPGESMEFPPKSLPIILTNSAIRLEAIENFKDSDSFRVAGEIWLVKGPFTYIPIRQAKIIGIDQSYIILPGCGLHLRALSDFVDRYDILRIIGEEWIVESVGSYLPDVNELVVRSVIPHILTQDIALHLSATSSFLDAFKINRKIGHQWLVTQLHCSSYLIGVNEKLEGIIEKIVLGAHQFCTILNPMGSDKCTQFGKRIVRSGVQSFFLNPGEYLENGIENSYILEVNQALLLKVNESYFENDISYFAGQKLLNKGPTEYFPNENITVLEIRNSVSLDQNEGIYIRHLPTGKVRSVIGPQSYVLDFDEEFFYRRLNSEIEFMLMQGGYLSTSTEIRKIAYYEESIDSSTRTEYKVITFRCLNNTAVQLFDYVKKTSRVVFGPALIMLGPHEDFHVLNLSAGKPKVEGALKSLCLLLGPDYITDQISVETEDHAKLTILYAMNNYFLVNKGIASEVNKLFNIPDFIGFACTRVASKIRTAVSQVSFSYFHRYSSYIIKSSVFGYDSEGKCLDKLVFDENNLVLTNLDIKSIEPVHDSMLLSLSKSVQIAISISINSTEAASIHEASKLEQFARSKLTYQKIIDNYNLEKCICLLIQLKSDCYAIKSIGISSADSNSVAARRLIDLESAINITKSICEARKICLQEKLRSLVKRNDSKLSYLKRLHELEVSRAQSLSIIESQKISMLTGSLSPDTIKAIAYSTLNIREFLCSKYGMVSIFNYLPRFIEFNSS